MSDRTDFPAERPYPGDFVVLVSSRRKRVVVTYDPKIWAFRRANIRANGCTRPLDDTTGDA